MTRIAEVVELIDKLPLEEQRLVFAHLRQKIPIHAMEKTLMAPAEVILEAIARASDLTVRGIEGIIAEATFAAEVVPLLMNQGWQAKAIYGDRAYDFLLSDAWMPTTSACR